MFSGNFIPFAVLYSVGNILTLLSTGFLIGPVTQMKQMVDPNRLVATIVFVVSLALTLVAAIWWKKAFLCILFVVIQSLAFIWYSISYIPFARDFIKSFVGDICF
eukprot:TRINITY_DN1913_c0_g1_i2.p1 TRINITY_DN1913_c0_g1~~TRINITY_DN1913_c0_g1_i2.p1  ORF type:complete len:105 (-),score=12.15 TRINITY_DN1913_c0_g1_i2:32-346(-)